MEYTVTNTRTLGISKVRKLSEWRHDGAYTLRRAYIQRCTSRPCGFKLLARLSGSNTRVFSWAARAFCLSNLAVQASGIVDVKR